MVTCMDYDRRTAGNSLWNQFRDVFEKWCYELRLELARGTDWGAEVLRGPMNVLQHSIILKGGGSPCPRNHPDGFDWGAPDGQRQWVVQLRWGHPEKTFKTHLDSFSSSAGSTLLSELKRHFATELEAGKFRE